MTFVMRQASIIS